MPYDLVIFDLDGVLVDSEIISANTIIDLVAQFGIDIDLLYVRRNFIGKSFDTVMDILTSHFGVQLPKDFETRYLESLNGNFEKELLPLPGAIEIVNTLKVKCCIATSSKMQRAERSLRLTGMFESFENHIYCASEVTNAKPAPDLFLHACLCEGGVPERTLVIEDSVAGLKAGLASGMKTVRFIGGAHLKGLKPVNALPTGVDQIFKSWIDFRHCYPSLFEKE